MPHHDNQPKLTPRAQIARGTGFKDQELKLIVKEYYAAVKKGMNPRNAMMDIIAGYAPDTVRDAENVDLTSVTHACDLGLLSNQHGARPASDEQLFADDLHELDYKSDAA